MKQIFGLLGWLGVTAVAAALGGMAAADAGDFYGQLDRPAWAPPAWLFAPVWSVLYVLMAIAAWLVWRSRGLGGARGALCLFLLQLVLNVLWTWLFFAWRQGAMAFLEIVVLWGLVAATGIAFGRVRPLAGILLLPYLLWLSFACALGYATWQLNPGLLS